MAWVNSCMVAFAMYSKIPMPHVEWSEDNRRYAICFFPAVGVVIGMLSLLWHFFCVQAAAGPVFYTACMAAIPLLLTGGIHLDGFLDTMDALHSYQPAKEKLKILKDPHIGAFAAISLLLYYLVYLGCLSEIRGRQNIFVFSLGFVLSRILSGLGVVYLKGAREEGLLYAFSSAANKKWVRTVLWMELVICIVIMGFYGGVSGMAVAFGSIAFYGYYRKKSAKEFGGITGDLAGWFLTGSEGMTVVILAVCTLVQHI